MHRRALATRVHHESIGPPLTSSSPRGTNSCRFPGIVNPKTPRRHSAAPQSCSFPGISISKCVDEIYKARARAVLASGKGNRKLEPPMEARCKKEINEMCKEGFVGHRCESKDVTHPVNVETRVIEARET
ncbi:unnamed protein product [Notodromas monacha]|uniref:Uncharacterized protein n=1 Tax=Notodromas monacha TaxID=399045 RepID=A0A7R9BF08_9CRUS|nr:unnamed protein product [Notodromas monacha]CAG0914173.1 unnamed protein product [Notodromas monacha]